MFNFSNPGVMRVDGDEQPQRVVSSEPNDTSKITQAEVTAASIAAARELAMTPYAELSAAERAEMTPRQKKDYITKSREEQSSFDAEERAASDPMFDYTNRPTAPPPSTLPGSNYIYYYTWIGGPNSGEWKLYRVANNDANQAKYGARAIGGTTQGSSTSALGANALVKQPQPILGAGGKVIGWNVDGDEVTIEPTPGDPTATNDGFPDDNPPPGNPPPGNPPPGSITKNNNLTQADVDAAVTKAVAAATAKTNELIAQQKADAAAAKFATKVKASDRLKAMFDGVGLGTLAAFIEKRIMEDASEESVLLELYDQPEYQIRFPGMKALRSKGKTITEAEYIKDEKAFAQTARFFDIPVGFYDTPDDFGKLIGNLVSPKEYQDRLQVGQDLARSMSPGARAQLQEFYNVGEGGITAYVLDPERASTLIQKQARAAQFVGFGREKGFKLEGINAAQAEQIAGTEAYAKLSALQLQQALGQAAQLRQTQSRLTGIEGGTYDESQALKAVIEGSPEALLASQQRAQREGARFSGGSGVTGSSLRSTTMI